MTTEDRAILHRQLLRDEGLRLYPYRDTSGKTSIGVGRNLTDVGISSTEALAMLDHDIDRAIADCISAFAWFVDLDAVRQRVLVNMAFNLGIGKLKTFRVTLKLIAEGRYKSAAAAMVQSLWAAQVGQRAYRLAQMLETGVDV
jgi:lysozyme